MLALVFFLWGNITAINSTLILFFFEYFHISWQQAILINVLFYTAPFLTCLPCSALMARFGYRLVLRGSLLLTMIGCIALAGALFFYSFTLSLLTVFIIATGVATMQVVANPYLALLSDERRRVGHLSLASALNSLGTTLAPLFIAMLLHYSPIDFATRQEPIKWLWLVIAAMSAIVIALTFILRLPDVKGAGRAGGGMGEVFRHRYFTLSAGALFIYVGIEVGIGTSAVKYLTTIAGWSMDKAMSSVALYWGGAMVGRVIFGVVAHRINVIRTFTVMASLSAVLVLMAFLLGNALGGYLLLMTGVGNAILYPVIFSRSLSSLPKLANIASGVLVMAGIGGAIIPYVQALIIDYIGLRASFILPIGLYISLALWGVLSARQTRAVVSQPSLAG